jgi:sugar phosphate permease
MMTASATAEVFFATDYLHTGSGGYGLLITGWTLGMAAGAAVFAPRLRGTLPVIALVAIVVQSVGLGLPTLWLAFGFTLVCWIIGGLAHGTKNVVLRTLIHERVPAHLHGRAYAGYNGARNAAELVAMISGGLIVTAFGARATLFLAGAIPAVFGLVGLAWYASTLRGATPVTEQT